MRYQLTPIFCRPWLLSGLSRIFLDDHEMLMHPGAVGVWTKADSVTAFDDFSYGAVGK